MVFLFVSVGETGAQRIDKRLQQEIETLIAGFNGNIGIYIKNLNNGKTFSINADTVFPTASTVKNPILIGVMDKINGGELKYNQPLTYRDSLLYAGVDILGSFKDSQKIELGKAIMLMLTMSDNTASLWLQKLAGTGTRINAILDSLGYKNTRVNSRTPGREDARKQFGWGQTTPKEMAGIMESIATGKMLNDSASKKMLRLLGRNFWDDVSIAEIPVDVFISSKNGAVNASRSEILFVNGRGAKYIFCVYTKNNKDESWDTTNEAWLLMRNISRVVWKRFSSH